MSDAHKEWLELRNKMIGGSDASAIIGLNPYKSNIDVWNEKTGRIIPEDIGNKPYVKYGKEAEKYLTSLFTLDFPQYEVTPNEYLIHYHPDYAYIGGTIDGSLVERESARKGILEIKTTEILNSMHREKWNEKIPDNYYVQCLHYLLATGWDFVVLKAQLKTVYGDDVRLNTRHYFFERVDVEEDLAYLLEQEQRFWWHVENDKRPNLVLPDI